MWRVWRMWRVAHVAVAIAMIGGRMLEWSMRLLSKVVGVSILLMLFALTVGGCGDDTCEKAAEMVKECSNALDDQEVGECGTDLNECMAVCIEEAYEKNGCEDIGPYYDGSSSDSDLSRCAQRCHTKPGPPSDGAAGGS